jgi:predicted porin
MRKTQMALAAVALVASTAALADVTVSGRFDYGYASNSGSTVKGVEGSLLAPNFVNVTGSEDLGGGMKAYFNWKNIVGNAGGLTNANANVGISTGAVGVKLGRVTDDFLAGVLAFDVTGGQNIGSAVSPMLQFGATGAFHSNAIQLDGNAANVNFGATYIGQDSTQTFATKTATTNEGQAFSGAQGDYSVRADTEIGGIRLGAAYANRSTAAAATTTLISKTHQAIGVGTNLGPLVVNGLYMKLDTTTVTGANGSYPLADALNAVAGYYNYDGATTATSGTLMSVGLRYAFSKQTTAFANFEKGSGVAQVMVGSNKGGVDTNNGVAIVGLAHSF